MKRISMIQLIVVLITNFTISSVCAQNTIQFGGSEIHGKQYRFHYRIPQQ